MQRTYSRKGQKRRSVVFPSTSNTSIPLNENPSPPTQRKRRKIEVEVVLPESRLHRNPDNSRDIVVSPTPGGSNSQLDSSSKPLFRTPLVPEKAHPPSSKASNGSRPSLGQASPTKSGVKDLSSLFGFSRMGIHTGPQSTDSHTGLAKRMLRRTKTESSLASTTPGNSFETVDSSTGPIELPPHSGTPPRRNPTIHLATESPGLSRTRSQPLTSLELSLDESPSPPHPNNTSVAPGGVRTYAGKARSFLVSLPASHMALASELGSQSQSQSDTQPAFDEEFLAPEDEFETRESYTDLRARWGVDNSEDDPWPLPDEDDVDGGKGKQVLVERLPPGMMNDLRSISELRSKGEARRFLDEMGYLFEGLEKDCPIGVRRGSAMEIVTKLCDPEFARRAKASDFFSKTWDLLNLKPIGSEDKVLDTILLFFIALLSRDPPSLLDLAKSKDTFQSVVFGLMCTLNHSNDPLWLVSSDVNEVDLKKVGISRAEKTILSRVCSLILNKSGLFDDDEPISARLLASQALSTLPPSFCALEHIKPLVQCLESEIKPLPARISAYISGLSLFPSESTEAYLFTPSFSHIDNCLRLLDAFILGRWSDSDREVYKIEQNLKPEREDGLGTLLMSLLLVLDIVIRDPEYGILGEIVNKCIESVLRVLISLTHSSEPWCQTLLEGTTVLPTVIRLISHCQEQRARTSGPAGQNDLVHSDSDDARLLDRLCLLLGLLTNLVQVVPEAKYRLHDLLLDPRCTGRRSCINSCTCPSRVNALRCLVQLYTEHCKSSADDVIEPVVRGHIAVLLGFMVKDSPENQRILLDALPGSSDRKKLVSLKDSAQEFILFYAEFAKKAAVLARASQDEDEDDVDEPDVEGTKQIADVSQDEQELVAAKSILRYLEELQQSSRD